MSTVIKRLLLLLSNCVLWAWTRTDMHIRTIMSPTQDFSTNQFGSVSITFHWQAKFEPVGILQDIKAKIIFPFALTAPLTVQWVQINDVCVVSSNMNTAISVASTITGDAAGAHFFDMIGAAYTSGSKYKMVVRITNSADIPTALGNTDPIKFELVSSNKPGYIIYGYNYNFGYMRMTSAATSNFELDLTPSYADPNIKEFTRDFWGKADLRLVDLEATRILFKMDNYVFSDDAESTCNSEPDDDRGIELLDRTGFYCEFEDTRKLGLYFIWREGYKAPVDATFRLKFRVKNPDVPASTGIMVSMFNLYSPIVLKFKSVAAAYSCGATSFGTLYPRLYVGPNLDVSSDFFPNVSLFSKGDKTNTIAYNSIRLEFKVSLDLPRPATSYTLTVWIGGNTRTTIPVSLIYHDLPVALGLANVKITVDPNTADIKFENIGELSSRSTYTIGFKVGLYGDETLNFLGENSFCALRITDSTGTVVVVNRKAPPNVKSTFKSPIVANKFVSTMNLLTYVHTREVSEVNTNYGDTYISTSANKAIGLRRGTNKILMLNFQSLSGQYSQTPTNRQTYVEMITSQYVSASPIGNSNWANANVYTNCLAKGSTGTDVTGALYSCRFDKMNTGLVGSEYSRFRIGGDTATTFYGSTSTLGWRNVAVSKMSSILNEGKEAAIIDFYVNGYSDTFTTDITANFPRGLQYQGLINGYVFDSTQFTSTQLFLVNYNRLAGSTIDGSKVPTMMRISGLLNGANTYKLKKIVLFFKEITALPLDLDIPYEVGCSTAATADVKCYYYQGVDSATCSAGTCTNFLSQNRLEILLSSTISSISDIYALHIMVPVYVPVGTVNSYSIVVGAAAQYDGSLSSYPDMLSMNPFLPAFSACSSCPSTAVTPLTSAQVNAGTGTANNILLNIGNQPTLGTTMSSTIDFNCNGASCTVVNPTKDFFSWTYCAQWDFMAKSTFSVNNLGSAVSETCVYDISYLVQVGATRYKKYCMFCPMWNTGTTASSVPFSGYTVPSKFGLKVPLGTWAAISGLQSSAAAPPTTYGLISLSEQDLLTANAFTSSSISTFTISPSTIYYDSTQGTTQAQSIQLVFTLVLSNPVPQSGYLVFTSSIAFPFDLISTASTSPYCYLMPVAMACTLTKVSTSEFHIVVPTDISAGTVTVTLWGLKSVKVIAALPTTYTLSAYTSIPAGKATTQRIDVSSAGAASLILDQYKVSGVDAKLNILQMQNLVLAESVVNYRTLFEMDITLGNGKYFLTNDALKINLGGGNYQPSDPTNAQPVYCVIVDPVTSLILPEFESCIVSDLSSIIIIAKQNTLYNSLRVSISNYIVKATSPAALKPTGSVYLVSDSTLTLQSQITADPNPAWPSTLSTVGSIGALNIIKQVSYFGLRIDFIFQITTTATAIAYESRVYVQFPASYTSMFGSFPVSCYQQATPVPIKLYCWRFRDRTLAITGFRNAIPGGTQLNILVYGIQQPLHNINENFYVSVDSDADPTVLDETGVFTLATSPFSVANSISVVSIYGSEYSHNYIRAVNSFIFRMNSPLPISSGSFINVFIDYLEFEFDTASYVGSCTVKETQTSSNLASGCVRQGNRYQITLSSTLSINTEYTVIIENIPTPDFYACKVRRPEIMITDSGNNLMLFSTDIFQDTDIATFTADESYTYFTFKDMTPEDPLIFKKGIYNKVEVLRSDGERFNDDFIFTLASTENGIFSQQDPSVIRTEHSHFGLASIPIYLASTMNKFSNQMSIIVNFTARFQNTIFAKLPLLRVLLSDGQATLKVPSSITVWTSKGSLPFYIKIQEIPISAVTFTISFTGTASLTVTPSSFTLGAATRLVKVKITSTHAAGPSLETPVMLITPTGSTGYGVTSVPITLAVVPTSVYTSTSITLGEVKPYGFAVDVTSAKPVSFYTITMPSVIYREFSLSYILQKYENNNRTDEKYYIDFTPCQGVEVLDLVVLTDELRAKENYKTIFYIEDIDGATSTSTLEFSTTDSAGGFGYVNLTFASPVPDSAKPKMICYLAQIFSYPLENLQTSDGFTCPSMFVNNNISTVEMDPSKLTRRLLANPDSGGRGLQMEVIDKTNSGSPSTSSESSKNLVQVYFLKNRRAMYDTNAYSKLQTVIIKDSFYSILGDRLKDYPQVTKKTPLISLQFYSQSLQRQMKIYNIKDMTQIQVTELKIAREGYLYCMILPTNSSRSSKIMGLHVKYGIDIDNTAAAWKESYLVNDPNWVIYLNIDDLTLKGDETDYTFYYYSTDKRVDELAGSTPVNKTDFRIWKQKIAKSSLITVISSLLLIAIVSLISL